MSTKLEPYKDEVIQTYRDGASVRDIASYYRVSTTGVIAFLRNAGIERRPPGGGDRPTRSRPEGKLRTLADSNGWETAAHEEYRRRIYGEVTY